MSDATPAADPLLSVESVNTFYGPVQVHFDLSFAVGRGQIVCLLGGNASGKSTTMKIILGLVKLASGIVRFAGEPITGLTTPQIVRRGVGSVPEARRLRHITFEEMIEMASAGSKVLQIRAVEFAGKYRVPTRVLSSLTDPALPVEQEAQAGTLITFEEDPHMAMEKAVISGVALNRNEAKITVHGVPDRPGIAYAILGPIADSNIDVDVIVQNVGHDGMTDLSFTVHRTDYAKALKLLKSQVQPHIKCRDVTGDDRIAKVSIVGLGMRSHAGIAAQMFRTLAEEGINIQMISTSEIKITVVIEEKYTELAVRVLHKAFELDQE